VQDCFFKAHPVAFLAFLYTALLTFEVLQARALPKVKLEMLWVLPILEAPYKLG